MKPQTNLMALRDLEETPEKISMVLRGALKALWNLRELLVELWKLG